MTPSFWSLALEEITDPDYTHVSVDVLPAHATADPAAWARSLLSVAALPRWMAGLVSMGGLFTRRSVGCAALAVRRVEGDEALVAIDTRRVDLRIGIGVDEERALVRVVAAIRMKGAAASLLLMPVRLLLPLVMHGLIARTRRQLSGVTR